MATKLNLGTEILADVSSLTFTNPNLGLDGMERFGNAVLTSGSLGLGNRIIINYSDMSSILHSSLITKFLDEGLQMQSLSVNKIEPNTKVAMSHMEYTGGDHLYVLCIAFGNSEMDIMTHTVTGKDSHTFAEPGISGGSMVTYTNSGVASSIDNFITVDDVSADATYTSCGVIMDCCTPVSYHNRSTTDAGYVAWIGLSDTTESGLQTALADYVIT